MTSLAIRWVGGQLNAQTSQLLAAVPIAVISAAAYRLVIPGERFDCDPGTEVELSVDIPRLGTMSTTHQVSPTDSVIFLPVKELNRPPTGAAGGPIDNLVLARARRARTTLRHDGRIAVDVDRALRRLAPAAASHLARPATIARVREHIDVAAPAPVSLSAEVATARTLPQLVMIPYAGNNADACSITPARPLALGRWARPRVEPNDPYAVLLMDYLVAGKFTLAGVAARAVESRRGADDPLAWSQPSFAQLLIGYSFALCRDAEQLRPWCRRTDAAGSLGTDGRILSAYSDFLDADDSGAWKILAGTAGGPPPVLVHGADIGCRLATLLLLQSREAESTGSAAGTAANPIEIVWTELNALLSMADPRSSALSVPASQDPSATFPMSRFEHRLRLLFARARRLAVSSPVFASNRNRLYQVLVGGKMSSNSSVDPSAPTTASSAPTAPTAGTKAALSGPALWVAIGAVAVWVGFSIVTLFFVTKNDIEWTRVTWVFGSIQSVAFAAAGALFGTTIQQQNVTNAQQQAASAKQDADGQRELATNGRALAATIQADGASAAPADGAGLASMSAQGADAHAADEVRLRHAQVAKALFGEVVKPT